MATTAEEYFKAGAVRHAAGQYESAIADYDKAIEIRSDYAEAYYYRGNTKTRLGQRESAIADYDKVIELKPDHVQSIHNRAIFMALLESKKGQEEVSQKYGQQSTEKEVKKSVNEELNYQEKKENAEKHAEEEKKVHRNSLRWLIAMACVLCSPILILGIFTLWSPYSSTYEILPFIPFIGIILGVLYSKERAAAKDKERALKIFDEISKEFDLIRIVGENQTEKLVNILMSKPLATSAPMGERGMPKTSFSDIKSDIPPYNEGG